MSVKVGGVRIDTTVLDKMTEEARPKAAKIVETYGELVTGTAMELAPVKTGSLKASIGSESKMTGELLYTVQDGKEYGIFQELGTRKMAAHPFMVPALEHWKDKFVKAFGELFR